MLAELVLAALALIYLRLRGYDLRWLGSRPSSIGCVIGMLLYVVAAIIAWQISLIAGNTYVSAQPIGEMLYGSTY